MDAMVESALIAAAATLLGVGGTVAVAIAGARNSRLTNERTLEAAREARLADRESEFADRYSRAIEQLGSDKLDVRIGGIYALEGIALDSQRNHPTVMELLTSFIREHSHEPWPPEPWSPQDTGSPGQERSTRPDVQAAVTVVGRRNIGHDIRSMDLAGAGLPRVNLFRANLAGADFETADLSGAYLAHADLSGAYFFRADLSGADLDSANLTRATLTDATLTGANLDDANLTGAHLTDANLTGAHLTGADLTGADLTGARWPEGAEVPDGWTVDSTSRRLGRAG